MKYEVKSTTNYDLFELAEINRDVDDNSKMERSMIAHGWIPAYPMHVMRGSNGKYQIKAGHHRLRAAKKLGIPVRYVVCNDSATIHDLEGSTEPWVIKHYMQSYVRKAIPQYVAVKEYVEETGISLWHAISLLAGESAGSHNKSNAFKRGTYKLGDQTHANQVKAIVLHMKKCGIKFATNSLLVQALSKVLRVDTIDINRLKDKIGSHAARFEKQPNLQKYIEAIEAIYNRQSKTKVPLAFLANEKAKERCLTFGKD
jgi:hypothetical protein